MEDMKLARMHLAFGYFQMSLQRCNHDPFFNELAVYRYRQGMYKVARDYLHTAFSLANEHQCKRSPIWEKIRPTWAIYTVIHRELLHSAIIDSFKTSYVFKPDQSCLAGSFDVFKMANSIGLKQDQVAIELEQDVRYMCDHTQEHPSVLFTEDAMIVNQGNLRPRESGE